MNAQACPVFVEPARALDGCERKEVAIEQNNVRSAQRLQW